MLETLVIMASSIGNMDDCLDLSCCACRACGGGASKRMA